MSSPALPGIFGAMAPVLNHYGYYAVGFLVTIEDFGIPVPGETVLIAASLYAGAGRMNIVVVGIVGFLAAVIGDNIGFLIGHFGGRALALRFGKYVFLTGERLSKAESFFGRHGGKIIVVARFIEGLRQANGIVAGISGMHWRRFVMFNAIGAALWVGVWVSAGYLAGNHIITIYDQLTRYSLYVLAALAVAVAALIGWHLRRRAKRRSRRAADTAAAAGAGEGPEAPATPEPDGTAGGARPGGEGREAEPRPRGPGHAPEPARPPEQRDAAEPGRATDNGQAPAPAHVPQGPAQPGQRDGTKQDGDRPPENPEPS
jgi:membrane protein DedA with SNARE-associated domain